MPNGGIFDDILNGTSNGGGGPDPRRPRVPAPTPAAPAPTGGLFDDIVGSNPASESAAPPAPTGPGPLSRWWDLVKSSGYAIQGQLASTGKLALEAGAALTGTPQTGVDAERLDPVIAEQKRQAQALQEEAGPAHSTLEAIGDFAATAAPYAASYALGGELLMPEELAGAGYGARVLATTKAALPITAALEAGDEELSSAHQIGTVLGQFDRTRALGATLERMSESPFGRVLVGGVLDVAGNALGEGIAEGFDRFKAAREARVDAANAETIANAPRWTPPPEEPMRALPPGQYDLPAASDELVGRTTQFEGSTPDAGYRMQANIPAEQELENALRQRRAAAMAADTPAAAEPPDFESPMPAEPPRQPRALPAGPAPEEPKLLPRLPDYESPAVEVPGDGEPGVATGTEQLPAAPNGPKLLGKGATPMPGALSEAETMRRAVNMARESAASKLPPRSAQMGAGALIAGYDYQHKDDQDASTRHKLVLAGLAAMGLASIPAVRESAFRLIGRAGAQATAHAAAGLSDPAVQRVVKAFAMSAKPAAKATLRGAAEEAYHEVFDKIYALGKYGREVLHSNTLRANAQRFSGVTEAAHEAVLRDFTPVAKAAKGIETQVAALAGAERALELDRAYPGVSKGISVADAQQTIKVLGQIPAVRDAADKLKGYYRQLLDRRLANDLITPDEYKALVAKGEHYIPFVRDFIDDVKDNGSRGSKGFAQKGNGVRAMTDEQAISQIKNPLEQAMVDTYLLEKQVARARVTKLVVEGYDTNRSVAQQFIREVTSPAQRKSLPIETVTVNGKARHFEFLDQGFHDAFIGLAPQSADLAMKVMRAAKTMQRVGVTMAPLFAARNAARDFTFTALQTSLPKTLAKAGVGAAAGAAIDPNHPVEGALMGAAAGATAGHALNVLRGFATVMGHEMGHDWLDGKVYSEFLREGGSGFGYFPRKQQELGDLLKELQNKGHITPADVVAPKNWWHALEMVNHAVEQAPRFAEYRKLRAAGTPVPDAILKARDLSVDFSNIGSGKTTQFVSGATPFFNAKFQGWDKNFRVFVGERDAATNAMKWFGPNQQRAATKAFALITAPSIALWWQNKDDPDYWKQDYWVRNLFWLVPKGNGEFWKIPKPFEVGYLFASTPERFLDWAYQHRPEMFKSADGQHQAVPFSLTKGMQQMVSALGVDLYNDVPGIIKPTLETSLNKDTFTGRDIVPDRMAQLPADQQYDDRTSTVARAIGDAVGASPMKVDHLINGYTGTLGRTVNAAISQELRGAGLDDRGPVANDTPNPFTQGIASNPESQPAPVTDLLDEDRRLQGVKAGIQNIIDQGRYHDLGAYIHEHASELSEAETSRVFADAIRQFADVIHQVELNKSLSADDRESRIKNLRAAQYRLAQAFAHVTTPRQ